MESVQSVLDLPQLYTRPSAELLLSTLDSLKVHPPSWTTAGSNPHQAKPRLRHDELVRYLTQIIASPLAWIDDDVTKEEIWEMAAARMSERSGRSAMGSMVRTFNVPMTASKCSDSGAPTFLEITLNEPALTSENIGFKTWASSFLLAKRLNLLKEELASLRSGEAILELGAGTGLVGIAAAASFGRTVVLTDLLDIVPNLEHNRRLNEDVVRVHGGRLRTAVLDWSQPQSCVMENNNELPAASFPLILAADVVYSPEHPRLFVKAVDYHLSRESLIARVIIELPLREAYTQERLELCERLRNIGLRIIAEGEEVGYDDWVNADDNPAEVRCWWSVWGWAC